MQPTERPRREWLRIGGWFFYLNAAPVALVSLRFLTYAVLKLDPLGWTFLAATLTSHSVLLAWLPFLLLYAPIVLVAPTRRAATAAAAIAAGGGLALLVVDTQVFGLYRFHIDPFVLNLLFGGAASEIFVFDARLWTMAAVIVAALIGLETLLFARVAALVDRRALHGGGLMAAAILSLIVGSHVMHAWALATYQRPLMRVARIFPLFFPLNANPFLVQHGLIDADRYRDTLYADADPTQDVYYPRHPIVAHDVGAKPNILVIVVDSWSARAFGPDVTPNIYRAAEAGLTFTNHWSGGNGTREGIFTLFYGIPGLYWDVAESSHFGPAFIDEALHQGYEPAVFASADLTSPAFERTVFRSVRRLRLHGAPGASPAERDLAVTTDWRSFLAERAGAGSGTPFFGFLFFDAPHAFSLPDTFPRPFQPAWAFADYSRLSNTVDASGFFNLERNCLFFDDGLVGRVLDDLKSRGLYDRTIVVITGDHGQEFNENGKNYWGHNGNFTRAQVGTPLVIHWPGKAPRRFEHQTLHYDVLPTIMAEAMGVDNPMTDYSVGRSLFDPAPRTPFVVGRHEQFAIIDRDRIVKVNFDGLTDVTDLHLNELADAPLDGGRYAAVLRNVNRFYRAPTADRQ